MISKKSGKCDCADSNVISTILLVVLTIILAVILCTIAVGFFSDYSNAFHHDSPEILKITHVFTPKELGSDTGVWNVKLTHVGYEEFFNSEYNASVYINGIKKTLIVIDTLNAHEFIPTHHYGVQRIQGAGPASYVWYPGQSGNILIAHDEINYGDLLKIEIYNKLNGNLYSVSEYRIPDK